MRRFLGLLSLLALIAASAWAFLNYQLIIDYAVASQYKPSPAVAELEKQVQFTERGSFLFHAAQAQLDDPAAFNEHCHKKDEQSVVLGCYISPQLIYIYDVKDSRLEGIRQVTAAHEMLHVAYDRLPGSEKDRINRLIDAALPSVLQSKSDLASRLEIYEKTEPGERYNELHSILGSEAEVLPAKLETYYAQYFKDRRIVTSFASSYAKIFAGLKANQEALQAELKALAAEISALSDEYNAEFQQLNNSIEDFNRRAESGAFSSEAEFNAEKAALLSIRDALEAKRQLVNDNISLYNQKRDSLVALNVQVDDLNSSLDSTNLPSL